MEELLLIADAALYDSKAAGRDRITVGAPLLSSALSPGDESFIDMTASEPQRPRARRPALHTAAEEEEPNGGELR